MNILEEIVAYKKQEIATRKKQISFKLLESKLFFSRNTLSATEYIRSAEKSGIIAEFKRKSPSKGIINNTVTVKEVTEGYYKYGASVLSVLTDTYFFGGSEDDLLQAREIPLPILRKDFIVDEYQIIESKAMGADIILLIAECLSKNEIKQYAELARSLHMEVLLELNHQEELDKICLACNLVGINNRDLRTFIVDINRSIELGGQIPKDFVKVSESGLSLPQNIKTLKQHGFEAFLIGENFMKEEKPDLAFKRFIEQL